MRFFVRKLLPAIVVLLCAHLTADAQAEFKGELVLTPLPGLEGRNMKVLQQFAYIDSKGQLWDVPAGMVTDGASIPRVLWVMFPPWTGNY